MRRDSVIPFWRLLSHRAAKASLHRGKPLPTALPVLVAFIQSLSASAATVTGLVMQEADLTDENPAAHVVVTLNSETKGIEGPVSTDRWGYYYFYEVEPGEYTIEVWVTGYKTGIPVTQAVLIPAEPEVELETIVVPNIL